MNGFRLSARLSGRLSAAIHLLPALAFVGFLFCGSPAPAATTKITVTVAMSSAPSDGDTITINGNVRTWKTSVTVASTQIAIAAGSAAGCKTNLFNQLALNPIAGLSLVDKGATSLDIIGACGASLTVSLSAAYGTQTPSSSTCSSMVDVRVPISGEPSGGQQTNIASLVVKGANDLSTNSFYENAIAVQNLVGLTNEQWIAGKKYLTNTADQFRGIVSNAVAITGYAWGITNGVFWTNFFKDPTTTNLVNFGKAISSLNADGTAEQFGSGALGIGAGALAVGSTAFATNILDAAIGNSAIASGPSATAVGNGATALAANATALGKSATATADSATAVGKGATAAYASSTAIGASATADVANQIKMGTSSEFVRVPGPLSAMGNCELTFNRYAISSLANGNNLDLAVGTNTFIEVSGPTGAFAILGIANGRDGKQCIILNRTGQNMTIATEGGAAGNDPTAANRITCLTGADRATTGNGAAWLIYDGSSSRWICLHVDP